MSPHYEAVADEAGGGDQGEDARAPASRRALVLTAVGTAMAVCCVAAVDHVREAAPTSPLTLGVERLLMGGRISTQQYLEKQTEEGLRIGTGPGKKVKFFTLDEDPSIGSQSGSWAYSGANGPAAWATVAPEFAVCSSGQSQSPVDVTREAEKARLALPPLRWEGYEGEPFSNGVRESRAFYDGHSICLGGAHPTLGMAGPVVSVHGFSRYLPELPLDKVAVINYTLKEIRFHTPSEHQIDGQTYPFEMQLIHGCSPETDPPCITNKTMIVSALFTEARKGWGEKSPDFLSSMMDDLRLIEGVWSQYVASYSFDFGKVCERESARQCVASYSLFSARWVRVRRRG